MEHLTLQQITENTGISRRTIQRYENFGLVSPCGKNKYGHLLYDLLTQDRIVQINFFQKIGFSVREISNIIDATNEELKLALQPKIYELEKRCDELPDLLIRAKSLLESL